jgi:hypothetical protein
MFVCETNPLVLAFDRLEHKSFNMAKGLRSHSWQGCSTRSPSARLFAQTAIVGEPPVHWGSHARR